MSKKITISGKPLNGVRTHRSMYENGCILFFDKKDNYYKMKVDLVNKQR